MEESIEAVRRHSHVPDNVRINERTLIVALQLFAANSGACWFVPVTFCGEGRELSAFGMVDRPDGWLVACGVFRRASAVGQGD